MSLNGRRRERGGASALGDVQPTEERRSARDRCAAHPTRAIGRRSRGAAHATRAMTSSRRHRGRWLPAAYAARPLQKPAIRCFETGRPSGPSSVAGDQRRNLGRRSRTMRNRPRAQSRPSVFFGLHSPQLGVRLKGRLAPAFPSGRWPAGALSERARLRRRRGRCAPSPGRRAGMLPFRASRRCQRSSSRT